MHSDRQGVRALDEQTDAATRLRRLHLPQHPLSSDEDTLSGPAIHETQARACGIELPRPPKTCVSSTRARAGFAFHSQQSSRFRFIRGSDGACWAMHQINHAGQLKRHR